VYFCAVQAVKNEIWVLKIVIEKTCWPKAGLKIPAK